MAKILIVDDNRELLEVVSLLLKKNGFEVETAASGMEANTILPWARPDLLLMDVWLGFDDGRNVCRDIKRTNNNIPIILISATPNLLQNFKEYNADDAIEKPFDTQDLVNKINRLLRPAL
ncbi:MAG: response regulator [Ferruginibacter sp.]